MEFRVILSLILVTALSLAVISSSVILIAVPVSGVALLLRIRSLAPVFFVKALFVIAVI